MGLKTFNCGEIKFKIKNNLPVFLYKYFITKK